jgi:hypothetical protein
MDYDSPAEIHRSFHAEIYFLIDGYQQVNNHVFGVMDPFDFFVEILSRVVVQCEMYRFDFCIHYQPPKYIPAVRGLLYPPGI